MTVLTKTSGFGLIDEHYIDLEPGQVCSYRDDKTVHDYATRKQLLDGFKSLYPAKYQSWLNRVKDDVGGDVRKHPEDFQISFVVLEAPDNRIIIRFRGADADNYHALVLNKNGLLALAEEVGGVQNVVFSEPGAVTYGDKVQLRVKGIVRAGVNGAEVGSHTFSEIPGNLATIDLDGAVITNFVQTKL